MYTGAMLGRERFTSPRGDISEEAYYSKPQTEHFVDVVRSGIIPLHCQVPVDPKLAYTWRTVFPEPVREFLEHHVVDRPPKTLRPSYKQWFGIGRPRYSDPFPRENMPSLHELQRITAEAILTHGNMMQEDGTLSHREALERVIHDIEMQLIMSRIIEHHEHTFRLTDQFVSLPSAIEQQSISFTEAQDILANVRHISIYAGAGKLPELIVPCAVDDIQQRRLGNASMYISTELRKSRWDRTSPRTHAMMLRLLLPESVSRDEIMEAMGQIEELNIFREINGVARDVMTVQMEKE